MSLWNLRQTTLFYSSLAQPAPFLGPRGRSSHLTPVGDELQEASGFCDLCLGRPGGGLGSLLALARLKAQNNLGV